MVIEQSNRANAITLNVLNELFFYLNNILEENL